MLEGSWVAKTLANHWGPFSSRSKAEQLLQWCLRLRHLNFNSLAVDSWKMLEILTCPGLKSCFKEGWKLLAIDQTFPRVFKFSGRQKLAQYCGCFLSFVKVLAYSLFSMRREWLSIFDSIHFSTAIQIPDTLLSPRKRLVERVACLCVCARALSLKWKHLLIKDKSHNKLVGATGRTAVP